MNKLNTIAPNQLEKVQEIQKKYKGLDVPLEIREDERHLTHIALIRSAPNADMSDMVHTLQIVKLNEQALEVTKNHFARFEGVTFILHKAESTQVLAAQKEKEQAEKIKAEEEQAKKIAEENAKKDQLIKEQAEKIKAFEEREAAALAASKENTNVADGEKEEKAKAAKANGKG